MKPPSLLLAGLLLALGIPARPISQHPQAIDNTPLRGQQCSLLTNPQPIAPTTPSPLTTTTTDPTQEERALLAAAASLKKRHAAARAALAAAHEEQWKAQRAMHAAKVRRITGSDYLPGYLSVAQRHAIQLLADVLDQEHRALAEAHRKEWRDLREGEKREVGRYKEVTGREMEMEMEFGVWEEEEEVGEERGVWDVWFPDGRVLEEVMRDLEGLKEVVLDALGESKM
ncbi:hypothetical protein B0T25DRAFT_513432 [Lasiosphaeria hispida]|uniref:Uncharacterized protein n=1 Tax=Lasiosphaeria hispida TaxID=260671 RepID=A0AAJ0HVD9_9PEZI|nr:hypothetical protein B0T25DRAFT_513432 [Lasiosphaeria hispida]